MELALRTACLVGILCFGPIGCGKQEVTQHDDARPVRTITAGRTDDPVGATYSGEIRARYESKLGFKVSGKVAERLVEVGSHVTAGQPLLRLDPQDAALSAASAAAQTEAARIKMIQSQIDLDRYSRLFGERFISKAAVD